MAELIEFKCAHDIYSDGVKTSHTLSKTSHTLSNGLVVEALGELPSNFFSAAEWSMTSFEVSVHEYCDQGGGSIFYNTSSFSFPDGRIGMSDFSTVCGIDGLISDILDYMPHMHSSDDRYCHLQPSDNQIQKMVGVELRLTMTLNNPVFSDSNCWHYWHPIYIVEGYTAEDQDNQACCTAYSCLSEHTYFYLSVFSGGYDNAYDNGDGSYPVSCFIALSGAGAMGINDVISDLHTLSELFDL